MNKLQLAIADAKTSNAGNTYWPVKVKVLDKAGEEIERDARIVVNPRFEEAYQEAVAQAKRCTVPSFNLLITDMERAEGDYNGTGSTWRRGNGEHVGNFGFQGHNYDLTIKRDTDITGAPFEVTLDVKKPVDLATL